MGLLATGAAAVISSAATTVAAAASAEEQQRQQQQLSTSINKDEAVMEISLATSSKCTQTKLESKLEKETPSNEEVKAAKSEVAIAAATTEQVSENATTTANNPVDNEVKGGEGGGSKMSVDQLGEGVSEESQGPVQGPRPQGEVCPWEDE